MPTGIRSDSLFSLSRHFCTNYHIERLRSVAIALPIYIRGKHYLAIATNGDYGTCCLVDIADESVYYVVGGPLKRRAVMLGTHCDVASR
jgi:hypothetical protein